MTYRREAERYAILAAWAALAALTSCVIFKPWAPQPKPVPTDSTQADTVKR